MKTVLVALDSQYIHQNLAIRSLAACCPPSLRPLLREYNINQQPFWILKDLLSLQPDLIGFSCYIWNIEFILHLCQDLKKALPCVRILLGGPEVSFTAKQWMDAHMEIDFILCGEGEDSLPMLLDALERKASPAIPGVIYRKGGELSGDDRYQLISDLDRLPSPYGENDTFTDEGKILYYESSRGCPFSCSYCLSGAMGGGVRERSLPRVKEDLRMFVQRQVPIVKLVDRTFNAHPARAKEIVRFINELGGSTRFHLEIGADLLDEEFLALFAASPIGTFQLEAGVQSCNPTTLDSVVRKTNLDRLEHNVRTLINCGKVHLHLDLIAGLPYEGMESFAHSFDRVYRMGPHQLQLGFLKLLKGSSLWKNAQENGLICRDYPPYEVLSTPWMSSWELLRLKEVEEVVERYYNTGRARRAMDYLMKTVFTSPFDGYRRLADYCSQHGYLSRPMSAKNQYIALGEFARDLLNQEGYLHFLTLLKLDYLSSGAKGALPPLFEQIRADASIQDLVRRAKLEGVITSEQARRAKFDLLPVHPESLQPGKTFVMVEPQVQDPLTGACRITVCLTE